MKQLGIPMDIGKIPKQEHGDRKMIKTTSLLIFLLVGLVIDFSFARPEPAKLAGMVLADQASFWQPYQTMLDNHLSTANIDGIELTALDYRGVKDDPAFKEMVKRLEKFSLLTLKSGNDSLAFWVNAYNFLAIKIVVDNYPVESIKDIGSLFTSVWKKDAGFIGEKEYTLNEIEHEILRKQFKEPRIHFAIVCASLSCPDLRKGVYLPGSIDAQLEDNTRSFLNNAIKGVLIKNNKAEISKIFKWFPDDFKSTGGVWKFIQKYRSDLGADKEYSIDYLTYDWRLNEI
jgi:Protein of unknown function, DUF547